MRRRRVQAGQELARQRRCSARRSARSTTTWPRRRSRSCATARSRRPPCAGATRRRHAGRASRCRSTQLADWVSEAGNPGNEKQRRAGRDRGAEPAAEAGPRHRRHARAWAGSAPATPPRRSAFLPFADGLIFVSDASAELSAPEVDVPPPGHRAVPDGAVRPDEDRPLPAVGAHRRPQPRPPRAPRARAVPMVAVSSAVRAEALARKDRDAQRAQPLPRARQGARRRGRRTGQGRRRRRARRTTHGRSRRWCAAGCESEKAAARRPRGDEARRSRELDAAKQRLEHLRGPGARWSVLVGDRMADLSNASTFEFRGAMRTISRNMDEVIEGLRRATPGTTWSATSRPTWPTRSPTRFVALERGPRRRSATRSSRLLGDEDLDVDLGTGSGRRSSTSADLWQGKALDDTRRRGRKKAFDTALTGIRGAQGGIMMFGMMGQFLPAAAGRAARHQPGAARHRRPVRRHGPRRGPQAQGAQRRQTARTQVRQFLDDVQFEVGNQISAVVRDIQRELRDEFTERLGELQRTYTDAGQAGPGGRPADPERAPAARPARSTSSIAALTQDRSGAGGGVMTEAAVTADGPAGRSPTPSSTSHRLEAEEPSAGGRRCGRSASGSRARCASPSPAGSRPASRRCSTRSSASGWRRPTPASAPGSCRGTARARATRSAAQLRDGSDQPLGVQARTRAPSTSSSARSPSATCAWLDVRWPSSALDR